MKSYSPRQTAAMPQMDESFVDSRIEQYCIYEEEDGTKIPPWCQGVVIAVKKSNKVKIEWNQKHQSEGCPMITDERLMINEK